MRITLISSNYLLLTSCIAALLGGVMVGSVSPALVIARSAVFSITLLHSVLAGGLLGVFLTDVLCMPIPPVLTATLVTVLISVVTAEATSRGFSEDSAIAMSVCTSVTMTILLTYYLSFTSPLGIPKAMSYVFGMSSLITYEDIARLGSATLLVAPLTHIFWNEVKYVFFDAEGAYSMGLRTKYYRYLLYVIAAIAAASLAMSLGVLISHIVLTAPGLIAMRLSTRRLHAVSYTLSLTMMILGYLIALALKLPPSAGVGIFASLAIIYVLVGVRR